MNLNLRKHFIALTLLLYALPSLAQTLTDGPIQLRIRVREINTRFSQPSDGAVLGVGFLPDDYTYYIWARDNSDQDAAGWQGGACLTADFNPPGPSPDLNYEMFNHTYTGTNVPEFFDLRIDAWEDDLPTDGIGGVCNNGSRCAFNCCNQCCGVVVFGNCVGLREEDDDRCDANPHATALTYRQGPPCQWFSHGYVAGVCTNYQPRIETFWRYTRGENCSAPLALGQLNPGGTITHFNSNQCYTHDYGDPGNDVFYSFTVSQPMGARISLCGATWNTTLYLLDANCNTLLYQNLDGVTCPPQSEINANLCQPGTYIVVVDGSTSIEQGTFSLVIAEDPNAGLLANVQKTDVACNGAGDGSATANVTGGIGPYTYLWTPGNMTGQTVTGLNIGNYSVRVTDSRGCFTDEAFTIGQPTPLGITVTSTNPSCNGGSNGTITVPLVSGGVVPYEYSLGGPYQVPSLFSGLLPGNYTVSVRDDNGCIETEDVTLINPPRIAINPVVTPVSCAGFDDGSIAISPSFGNHPYMCALDLPAVFTLCTAIYENVSAGNHTITVQDNNGCEVAEIVNVPLVPALTINLFSKTDLTCHDAGDGAFEVVSTGGTPPIMFSINGGVTYQSSPIFSGLDADHYTVLVEDDNGCSNSLTVQVEEPSVLILSVLFQIPVTCNGLDDGFMVVSASGGSGPYLFSLDSVNFYQSGAFDNLPGGNYRFIVVDDNGCTATLNTTMLEPDTITVHVVSSGNASCDGINDGFFTLGATGGTPPFKYSLNNGPFQTNATFSGLAPGNYLIGVEDRSGCLAFDSASLGSNVLVGISVTKTDVLCNGDNTGEIVIAGSAGVGPYSYSINNVIFQPTGTFSNLTAGNYTAIVRDANGCRAVQAIDVVEPPELTATIDSIRDASCPGIPEGAIYITPHGGDSSIYTFNWSNQSVTEDIFNVVGGQYYVTITDGNACFIVLAPIIDQPAPAFTDITRILDVSCNGEADGYVDMDIAGGVPPFQYLWSNNTTNQDLLDVSGGTYYVTVTDDSGCTKIDSATVVEPDAITSTIVATDVSCATSADGNVDLTVLGGTPPYDFFWSNFAFSEDLFNVPAGTYTVRISDDNSCSTTNTVTINTAPGLTATLTITDVTCFGNDDGSVEIIMNGGTPPYFYDWSNNATTSVITGLAPGIYDVTVVDSIACSGSFSALVEEPEELLVSVSVRHVLCNGDNTGIGDPEVTGGVGPYTYLWSTTPPDSNRVQYALTGGGYVLEVRDRNDCVATEVVTINQPPPLSIEVLGTSDVLCIDGDDGEVTVRAAGGVAPYQYSVHANRFQYDSLFTGLEAGDYGVMVLDDNGCMATNAFTLLESPGFSVNLPPYLFLAPGASDTLVPEVTSPLPIISYHWTPSDYLSCTDCPTPVVSNIGQQTTYILEVTDSNGCIAQDEITVIPTGYDVHIPNAFTPNGDGLNDVLLPIDFGGVNTMDFQIFNRWGALVFQTTNINEGWDGTQRGKELMPAVFVYHITGEFLNGETFDKTGSITLLR